jgi:hypothetical protein
MKGVKTMAWPLFDKQQLFIFIHLNILHRIKYIYSTAMNNLTEDPERPSRQRQGTIIAATIATGALILLASSPSGSNVNVNRQSSRRLWGQNIFWAGDPTMVPPPPPPPPPPKQAWKQPPPPVHHYQPVPPPAAPKPPGNPFEKFGPSLSSSSSSNNVASSPPPPPPPAPVPVPVAEPTPFSASAISSSSYYSRPQNSQSAQAVVEEEPPPQQSQQIQQFSQPVEQQTAPAIEEEEPPAQAFTAEPPVQVVQQQQQQQVAPAVQTATITSSLELNGIPSVIPPSGSMERMALLNLLVHRIDSQLSSLTNNPVRDITILAIGDTDMTVRRLRGGGNNDVESVDNRSLWSTIQVVKFQALLEYICGDKNEEECINNAQASADDVIRQLATKSPTVSPASSNNGVDNTGEEWSSINDPSSSYVWILDPSNEVDYEVITSKPTGPPTFHPSLPPTANTTPSPTLTPSSLPMQSMQSYTVNIQIDTNTPEPTSSKPTSPSAITDNEWFTNAGFFQGEASKRFCGYDWNDVVTNCL